MQSVNSMASTETETEGDNANSGLLDKVRESALDSCNSIKSSLGISRIICSCITPLIHSIDVGTDMNLAYRYYSDNEYLYSALTAFFIVGPTILLSLLQKM